MKCANILHTPHLGPYAPFPSARRAHFVSCTSFLFCPISCECAVYFAIDLQLHFFSKKHTVCDTPARYAILPPPDMLLHLVGKKGFLGLAGLEPATASL